MSGIEAQIEPIIERIENRALFPVSDDTRAAILASPDPLRAAVHLERWLAASSGPTMYLSLLNEGGPAPTWLMRLLAGSHQVADVLVQNPELGAIFFEPFEPPDLGDLLFEGRRLLEVAQTQDHRLDRLRLLKQRWMLRIAYADVNDLWVTASILKSISVLADAILILMLEVTWESFARDRSIADPCPLNLVAFGKHGGRELNYSSDIDLVYVIPDDTSEALGTQLNRFCTIFGRALENQMGRGMLYRVDLRLRPYGSRGAILSRMRGVMKYYENYAETWEHMALIRSRVVAGNLAEEWEELRNRICFGSDRGTWQVEELLNQRAALEDLQVGDDLKRGPGGIRDIEFLVQIHQLIYGKGRPKLRQAFTFEALDGLAEAGLFSFEEAEFLGRAYQLLRTLEHRLQLEGNLQTHTLPADQETLTRLAHLFRRESPAEFQRIIADTRRRVREIYDGRLRPMIAATTVSGLQQRAPDAAETIAAWLETLNEPDAYRDALLASEGGVERLAELFGKAPALLPEIRESNSLLERLISGEIEESIDARSVILAASNGPQAMRSLRVQTAIAWVLRQDHSLSDSLDAITDAVLFRLLAGTALECVALGSYATHESGWLSDADIVLFCPPTTRHLDAEQEAQEFLRTVQEWKSAGAPLSIDLRLRPEGKSGLLARTYEGFRNYIRSDMENWERLASGRARLIHGSPAAIQLISEASTSKRLSRDMLADLLVVKHRLETELMNPPEAIRHLKHGPGGFEDISWLIELISLSHPELRNLTSVTTPNRLRDIVRAGILNTVEFDALLASHRAQHTARVWIELQGFDRDLLPENPVKLESLAKCMADENGNAMLKRLANHREVTRAIFLDQIDRLQKPAP